MKFNINIISRTIVYFGLFITSSYILIIGPVKEVLKNKTRLEETILHIGGNFHTISQERQKFQKTSVKNLKSIENDQK